MKTRSSILTGVFSVLWVGSVWAQSTFAPEQPSFNRKVRNLGMGNVGIALDGTADSSPFYNPAGLNDIESGRFQFFSITGDVSKNSVSLIKDVKDFANDVDSATPNVTACQGITNDQARRICVLDDFINQHTGEFQHARFTLDIFNYARHNFAVGVSMDERLDLSFRNRSFPHFDMRNLGDVAGYIAASHDFWEKMLQVGVTVRPTVRFSLDQADETIEFADVTNTNANGDPVLKDQFKKIKNRRFGLGVDLGLKSALNFPVIKEIPVYKYLRPEVGLTWQDIGSPTFRSGPPNNQSVNAGVAVHPDVWKLKNTVGLDVRNLNQHQDFLPRLHIGAESQLAWKKFSFAARAGANQGYWTAGLTFDLWLVRIDGAIYHEEVGTLSDHHGDLRYAGTVSFNI